MRIKLSGGRLLPYQVILEIRDAKFCDMQCIPAGKKLCYNSVDLAAGGQVYEAVPQVVRRTSEPAGFPELIPLGFGEDLVNLVFHFTNARRYPCRYWCRPGVCHCRESHSPGPSRCRCPHPAH